MSDQYPQQCPQHDPQQGPYDPTAAYPSGDYRPQAAAYGAPPVSLSPEQERTWGAIGHGAALVAMVLSAGLLGFFASLGVYLVHKDRGPFVRAHAANSLNVQITMFIWIVISFPLILAFGLGIVTLVAAPFVAGLLHLLGAIKAYNGEWWNPPLTPRFIR